MSSTKPTNNKSTNVNYNITTIRNKFPCKYCKQTYPKRILQGHEEKCVSSRTCTWCNVVFRNRGNLASHTKHLHQNNKTRSTNTEENTLTCVVCDSTFLKDSYLRYHIRREHYNLKTKIAMRGDKKINEVWFERVFNSNILVEMSKPKLNTLHIKKYEKNTEDIEIDMEYADIDLSDIYPLHAVRINCEICDKIVLKKSYKKHLDEKHSKCGKKHHCINCNKSFKRLYFYIKHTCNKTKSRRKIIIDQVRSLHSIPL